MTATNRQQEATMSHTTFSVNNTFETHQSASYKNAIAFAVSMAKAQPTAPVRISWEKHEQIFAETFMWSDAIDTIAPYYGGLV